MLNALQDVAQRGQSKIKLKFEKPESNAQMKIQKPPYNTEFRIDFGHNKEPNNIETREDCKSRRNADNLRVESYFNLPVGQKIIQLQHVIKNNQQFLCFEDDEVKWNQTREWY